MWALLVHGSVLSKVLVGLVKALEKGVEAPQTVTDPSSSLYVGVVPALGYAMPARIEGAMALFIRLVHRFIEHSFHLTEL